MKILELKDFMKKFYLIKQKIKKVNSEQYKKVNDEFHSKKLNEITPIFEFLLDSTHEQLQKLTIKYLKTPDFLSKNFSWEIIMMHIFNNLCNM